MHAVSSGLTPFLPSVEITRKMPDYPGYVFAIKGTNNAPPGTLFAQDRVVSYIPSDDCEYRNDGVTVVAREAISISFRILNKKPEMGQPLDYDNVIKDGVCGDDSRVNLIFKLLTPVGKFNVDDAGKNFPWIPGHKSVLIPLDQDEVRLTPLELIKKARDKYFIPLNVLLEPIGR